MKIVPLADKIVVKRTKADEISTGGIVLPQMARQKPAQGRVLSVGEGKLRKDGSRQPPQVSEGDRVLFAAYAGSEIQFDGTELLILTEDDVFAVIE